MAIFVGDYMNPNNISILNPLVKVRLRRGYIGGFSALISTFLNRI